MWVSWKEQENDEELEGRGSKVCELNIGVEKCRKLRREEVNKERIG